MKIAHVYSVYNHKETDAELRAQETWERQYRKGVLYPLPVADRQLKRNSYTELGDSRRMPFIKDLFDFGFKDSGDDKVVLTNLDVGMVEETSEKLSLLKTGWSFRVNMSRPVRGRPTIEYIESMGTLGVGVDLVMIDRESWFGGIVGQGIRDLMPDMLLGCEGWDWVLRFMLGQVEVGPLIYHENHSEFWRKERLTNVGNLWNRYLAYNWWVDIKDSDFKNHVLLEWPELKLCSTARSVLARNVEFSGSVRGKELTKVREAVLTNDSKSLPPRTIPLITE